MSVNIAIVAVALFSLLPKITIAQVNAGPIVAGKCSGQSCYVATLATTTGEPYKMVGKAKPSGGSASGDRCIKNVYKQLGLPAPEGLKRRTFVDLDLEERNLKDLMAKAGVETTNGSEEETFQLEKRQTACKPNTLIFAKATIESGPLGMLVGPALSAALSKDWAVEPVSYTNDINGIFCLGMEGGQKCVKQINALAARCPNTKIVTSGYSQGCMVVRFCVAHADEKARALVKGIATFGDPFNGAPVKDFPQSKIKTWCATGDGVCSGKLSIGAAHMSYSVDISAASKWIETVVKT